MSREGFPVPPGFILTTLFFRSWIDALSEWPEWKNMEQASPGELKGCCDRLKDRCSVLFFDDRQKALLTECIGRLIAAAHCELFAVRSSSPEEDLEGASFAGGYTTSLGVLPSGIEEAVKTSFASLFDTRVLLYKREHGFNSGNPRIAVIVQEQIPSEKAGVAFSINPLNNCYDEAVVNANRGLGESVVAGLAAPDLFVVDKVTGVFLDQKSGGKETVILLDKMGGIRRETVSPAAGFCLASSEVLRIVDLVKKVETSYGQPVDIEWAFAGNRLFLLQARPVTAWIPLPASMLTKPGERRILYYDHTLHDVQDALTVLGTEFFREMQSHLTSAMMGNRDVFDAKDGLFVTESGRGYANYSNTIRMTGRKMAADAIRTSDAVGARMIDTLDLSAYIPRRLPARLKGVYFSLMRVNVMAVLKMLKKLKKPEKFHADYLKERDKILAELQKLERSVMPVKLIVDVYFKLVVPFTATATVPLLAAVDIFKSRIKKIFRKTDETVISRLVYLYRCLPHNVTVEMGLALSDLACYREIAECRNEDEFVTHLHAGSFSSEFKAAWENFMQLYGCRCPREVDIAVPRYSEAPGAVFRQLQILSRACTSDQNPRALYEKGVRQREETYAELYALAQKRGKARKFAQNYHLVALFSGYRELPKYLIVKVLALLRKRILEQAAVFVAAGRLVDPGQIFNLTLADIELGLADITCNLQEKANANAVFYNKIKHVKHFPRFIDSRGKILKPLPRPAAAGELAGDPISPGIVRGKVKVLHEPDEKPVFPGEILVAHLTDPGWTPLFLNAGGIILEIGGVLQHGALVAREYAKPCIAGITGAVTLLQDGQEIEMDGATGIIRFLDKQK